MFSPEIALSSTGRRRIDLRYDDVIIIVSFLVWLTIHLIRKNLKFLKSTPLDKQIIAFILICVLSTARGVLIRQVENPLKAFLYVLKLVEFFFIYYLVINTVQSKDEIRRYIFVFIITLIFTILTGYEQLLSGVWRISTPFEDTPEPNTMGGYLLFMFSLIAAFVCMGLKIMTRFFLWIVLGATVWIFLHTLSRGSYLGYFPVLITLICMLPKDKKVYGLLLLIGSIIAWPYLPQQVKSRIDRTFVGKQEYRLPTITGEEKKINLDSSSSSRVDKYENVLKYWREYPVFGLGITGAGFIDSSFFRTIGELGLIGMLIIIWLFYTIIAETFNAYNYSRNKLNKAICIGYICGMIGLIVHAMTANTFFLIRIMGPFWFLTGVIFLIPPLYFDEIAKPYGTNLIEFHKKQNNIK